MLRAVADTHAVVWYLFDDKRLSPRVRDFFQETAQAGDTIGVSPITLVELVYVEEKARLASGTFELLSQEIEEAGSTLTLLSLGLTVLKALESVERGAVPDMPDRIIAATAVAHQLPLLSRDTKIQASTVETIW